MHIFIAKVSVWAFLLTASVPLVTSQIVKIGNQQKGKYRTINVEKLEVAPDVDIPTNQINVIWLEIVDELHKIKKFDRVIKRAKPLAPAPPDIGPTLLLQGNIARYYALVSQESTTGVGDIWTHIKIQIRFVDAADGKVLLEKEIDRRVFFGIYQLYLGDVGRKIAKEVAKIAEKSFF